VLGCLSEQGPKRRAACASVMPQRFRSRNNISTNIEPTAEDMTQHRPLRSKGDEADRAELAGASREERAEGKGSSALVLLAAADAAHRVQREDHGDVDGHRRLGDLRHVLAPVSLAA
jgi:hypothetical protein